jgi:predicted Ser/Thr protein kinase
MVLDYHLQILQLALIILLFAFVRRARPLIQMDNGIILGFAVLSASFLFAWLKRSFLPETTRDLTAELLPMASFCVSNAIWLFSGLTESSATTPPQQVNQISQGPTLPEMASVTSSAPPFEVPAAKEPVETLVPRKKTKAKKVRVDREIDHLRLGIHEPRFRMGTLISCGAMGMVYRAYDNERQHPVALKFIYREQRQNPHSMKRFRREALIGGKLRHENICKIYGFEENPADAFIIMEYVTGKNLERHIFKGRNEDQIAELLPIFLQIADALDHAHTRHVLHRDIKPGNVVLSRKRIVKLVDFGTAKLKEPPLSNLTGDNLIGTLAYCPPELIQNKAATVQSDLYSFGCLMYALTTGSHPFLASTHSEMILAIERNDLRPPKNLNPNMPVGLEEIILRSLKRDLDERYASAAQIWTDLRNVYRRRASKEAA